MIKEVAAHEARNHWTLMKNSEVNKKHKNRYDKLKTILPLCSFKRKRSPDGILLKHKARLWAHGGI